jgi:DnaJ domain
MIRIKGHKIPKQAITSAFSRRALQFKNNIVSILEKIGVESMIDIPIPPIPVIKVKAEATWYFSGHRMYCSYNLQGRFVDNLYVLSKLIEIEAHLLASGQKTADEFVSAFREEDDVEDKRIEARKFLGIEPHVEDMTIINAKYKQMAKEFHPDMPTGDTEKFKKLNIAHKILQRELV